MSPEVWKFGKFEILLVEIQVTKLVWCWTLIAACILSPERKMNIKCVLKKFSKNSVPNNSSFFAAAAATIELGQISLKFLLFLEKVIFFLSRCLVNKICDTFVILLILFDTFCQGVWWRRFVTFFNFETKLYLLIRAVWEQM